MPEIFPTEPASEAVPFEFTGKTSEYFGIWIVNTLLTIVTLGVYSAWAKVRSQRYFYRNTQLLGSGFDYTGNPWQILKGRALVAALLLSFFVLKWYAVAAGVAVFVVTLVLSPWVLVASLAFKARNTTYRNVRFRFVGTPRQSYRACLEALLVQTMTCGIGYPYGRFVLTEFVTDSYRFGDQAFVWRTSSDGYYRVYFKALLITLLGLGALAFFRALGDGDELLLSPHVARLVTYAYFLVPLAYLRARLTNLRFDKLTLGQHRFACRLNPWRVAQLYATNLLGIIASAGLLVPWAKVRTVRYTLSRLTLLPVGGLEISAAGTLAEVSAIGDAAGEHGLDLDIGI